MDDNGRKQWTTTDPSGLNKHKLNRQLNLMAKARLRATFKTQHLTDFLYKGRSSAGRRRAAFERVEAALGMTDTMNLPMAYLHTGREEQYLLGLKFGKAIMDDELKHRHGFFDFHTHQYALSIASPFGHNTLMFGPTLELQASPAQKAQWMPLVEAGKVIGSYVQTELGHGTFVRGLETTATFDESADEFVINSPTLTSTKYWPSALAFSASHIILMAKLVIKDKSYGVHPFLVQIRSLEDYRNLPGIETGDIGSKMGFNTTDMGYATFKHIRIPRDQMLMGNAKVLRDGTYVPPAHNKLSYTTLTYTRVNIITTVAYQLAQAAVIASRFSVVREQGSGMGEPTSAPELAIIDYKTQKYRLLTIMSQAYALVFASQACTTAFRSLQTEQLTGDHRNLPKIHALTAGLKAYSTQVGLDGAEDARKCCGGFGFADLSGFHATISTMVSLPTLEGENYVMYLQTARYLMKGVSTLQQNQAPDEALEYLRIPRLSRCNFNQGNDFLCADNQIAMFRHRASRLTFHAATLLTQGKDEIPYAERWNKHALPLVHAARAHIELFVLENFVSTISKCPDHATRHALKNLCDLFALTAMENPNFPGAMAFVEDGYLNFKQLSIIRQVVEDLLARLHPDAIALGDAWDFTDHSLSSAIGMYDGNIYERLMAWTKQLPLNVKARHNGGLHREGYESVIKGMLKARL